MLKKRFNLFGGGFQHSNSSTLYKNSKNIVWDYNSKINKESFYVDNSIMGVCSDTFSEVKYGWILESKHIVPEIENFCIDNMSFIKKQFKYIFTHNKKLIDLDSEFFKFAPANGTWIENIGIRKKNKLVSAITSNKNQTEGHKKRLQIINKFSNKIDLFGRGFKEIKNKEEGLSDYKFSICIENGFYESYFTEKILDCFATATVPIYCGTPDIFNFFNKDGIIILDDNFNIDKLSDELYFSKIKSIEDNLERVKKFYTAEDWIYENYFINNL